MTTADVILLAIGRLLSLSTGLSEKAKINFAAAAHDYSLTLGKTPGNPDINFAAAFIDFANIISSL